MSETPVHDAAVWLAGRLREAERSRGRADIAVSGGSTAPALFAALLDEDVPWAKVSIWQVDERVVPEGDPRRNSLQLHVLPAQVHEMPVGSDDLPAAAGQYGRSLPARFDVVHLGVGADGHTASWPPGEPDVAASERTVELVPEFHGTGRMTLTARVVNAARSRMILAHGSAKAAIVGRWVDGDRSLPVTAVRRADTRVFLDPGAAVRLRQ